MRRPLVTVLVCGFTVLGAAGTAAAAEGPQDPLEQWLTATVIDVSSKPGASQDGAAEAVTLPADETAPRRGDGSHLLPDPGKWNVQHQSTSQHQSQSQTNSNSEVQTNFQHQNGNHSNCRPCQHQSNSNNEHVNVQHNGNVQHDVQHNVQHSGPNLHHHGQVGFASILP